jgi:glutathione S-transferase
MQIDQITLYWYWSTNPQKLSLALEELGFDYDKIKISIGKKENKSPQYLALNPRGLVPTLTVGDAVLWESGAALMYLAAHTQTLWPTSPVLLGKAMSLLFMETATFQSLAGTHYYQKVISPLLGKTPNIERLKTAEGQIQPILKILSDTLEEGDYLLGNFSLVDCAFAPWLPHIDFHSHPRLFRWRSRLMARPSWAASGLSQEITSLDLS